MNKLSKYDSFYHLDVAEPYFFENTNSYQINYLKKYLVQCEFIMRSRSFLLKQCIFQKNRVLQLGQVKMNICFTELYNRGLSIWVFSGLCNRLSSYEYIWGSYVCIIYYFDGFKKCSGRIIYHGFEIFIKI